MTQAEFDKLPGLLSAGQFRQATGLTEGKLREMRRAGLIRCRPMKAKFKFYKADAAEVGGFKFN